MKRRATQAIFALGLLLTITSVAWWVRGAWVTDTLRVFRTRFDDGILTAHLYNAAVDDERVLASWSHAAHERCPECGATVARAVNPPARV